ncbi:MAG: amidohydrolase [Actinomycetota bacterium]
MAQRTVFLNGKVFVADAARSWARAVAVVGDRIAAVGDEADVMAFAREADVVDLEGRALLPGFTDGHVHPRHGGAKQLGCNLLDVDGPEQARQAIAAHAADLAPEAWVRGGGWSQDWFERACPSAASLEGLVGDRPVFLTNRDGHGAWVNSAALRLAGVTADTPDPEDGRIERLGDGSPQGTLHEGAMRLVGRVMPPETEEEVEAALVRGQEHLLADGITGWFDAWVDEETHRAYRALSRRGELAGSVVGALWWDRESGTEQLDRLLTWREEGTDLYRPIAVKLMLDGVVENHTASLLEPYDGVGGTGVDMIDPRELKEIVEILDREGFQCHFHAIGDAAVRSALDAVEQARAINGWSGMRHSISHLQLIHPLDVPRFHRLGVAADIQPFWACMDGYQEELTRPFLGPKRSVRQYPFRSLVEAGVTLVGGSDWPVSTADVMSQVHVAATRLPVGRGGMDPLGPEERIDPVTALAAFTAGSAWHNHEEATRGTVAAGNLADLVVLDHDPFAEGTFGEASIEQVMARGRWILRGR